MPSPIPSLPPVASAAVLLSPRSRNPKTGDVPTVWVGASLDEARGTCKAVACPRLTDGTCYAQFGQPAIGHTSVIKSGADPLRALDQRVASARMIRVSGNGDPAGADRGALMPLLDKARKAGLQIVGYTHGWRLTLAADLRGVLMASCESPAEADEAVAQGWRAAVVLSEDAPMRGNTTPAGRTIVVCPAQASAGRVTCNTCRLCDGSRPGPVIGFLEHGSPVIMGKVRRVRATQATP